MGANVMTVTMPGLLVPLMNNHTIDYHLLSQELARSTTPRASVEDGGS